MARPRNPVEGTKSEVKRRTPVSGKRDILTARNVPEGYVARWVNDSGNRIQEFLDAGYEFLDKASNTVVGDETVDSSVGVDSRISKKVDYDHVNNRPIEGYLMIQRKEWYDEDQAEKQRQIDEVERSMRKQGKAEGRYGDVDIGE